MRILPPLPAVAQQASLAGTGALGAGERLLAAKITAPLAGDLYQARAGQMVLAVQSTIPLLRGQAVQLQLQQQGQGRPPAWVVVNHDEGDPSAPAGGASGTIATAPAAGTQPASGLTRPAWLAAAPTGPAPGTPLEPASVTPDDRPGTTRPEPGLTTASSPSAGTPARTHATIAATPANPLTGNGREYAQSGTDTAQPAALTAGRTPAVAPAPPVIASERPAATVPATEIRQHLQATMPRQQDPTRLLALLQTLRPLLEQPQATASPLQTAAASLLAVLPEASTLTTPEAVAGALRQSGLLHESTATGDTGDFKQALRQLLITAGGESLPPPRHDHGAPAGHLQPLPRHVVENAGMLTDGRQLLLQLAAEAEPVLARLETHQLMHLQQQDSPQQQWLFELPLRCHDGIDIWQMHVEKDQARGNGTMTTDSAWTLTLSVDFPETGALMIRLGLQGGQLHARFHAETAQTHARIETLLPELGERLSRQGLTSPQLSCQRGLPHRDTLPDLPRPVLEITA